MSRKFERNKYTDSLCSLYLLLIVCLCICSCTSEYNVFDNNNSKLLNFSVSVPEWKNNDSSSNSKTRATPISGSSFDKSSSFNIIADAYDGKSSYSTIIKNEAVSFTNNMWQTTATHYWPGIANNTVSFYAYYPTSISSSISHTVGSAPTFSYTVPDDAASQIDIMTATGNNISGNTNASTPLLFNHLFAAIQFSVGSNGLGSGTISSISIGNVYNSGTYTFGSGWNLGTYTKTYTINQPKNISGTSGEDIYSGTYTLMMIPQTVTNVTITIAYSNGGTLSKTISGTWEAGKTYNYKISFIREYNYTGNTQSFTVPISGTYKVEVWGAQGEGGDSGGKGGYSYGNIKLSVNTSLYVCIGGAGCSSGGYNGGGSSGNSGAGGGGATHIAISTNRGILKNYVSKQEEILTVAGGGGGNDGDQGGGGTGGGLIGGTGGSWDGTSGSSGSGGSQTLGGGPNNGSFGQGGVSSNTGNDYSGAGGGGWYGGGGCTFNAGCGGGGSGHLSSSLINGTTGMQNGIRTGNGYARITFISAN